MSAPNLHVALAIAVGLPASCSDEELVDEVYAIRRRAGELSYATGEAQRAACATQKFADVPLFPLDHFGDQQAAS